MIVYEVLPPISCHVHEHDPETYLDLVGSAYSYLPADGNVKSKTAEEGKRYNRNRFEVSAADAQSLEDLKSNKH